MITNKLTFVASLAWVIACSSCSNSTTQQEAHPAADIVETVAAPLNEAPEWSASAMMYEVNVRQYSKKGTLAEFTRSIPRLRNLGVDILWFMPVQPIGVENRKGTLGSYYSISDYTAVNPEFGTLNDFKETVRSAHSLGMKVILDWVANHSAFDNAWAKEHPEWYTRDEAGNILPPNPDWGDVADLNYDNADMRRAMIDAMKFWIQETDIDGFRCDVAGEVPIDFWEDAIRELRAEKEILMLAEWDEPYVHSCFNASYAWGFHHQLMEIGKGNFTLDSLRKFVIEEEEKYKDDAFKLRFTTNHDENTWKGTEKDLFGPNVRNFQALMFFLPGMPLMYSGQESILDQQLEFFEKDEIEWKKYALADFFKKLDEIREENPALWGGANGGSLAMLGQDCTNGIFAFDRIFGENRVRFIMNGTAQKVDIATYVDGTNAVDLMTGAALSATSLAGHDFVILQINP